MPEDMFICQKGAQAIANAFTWHGDGSEKDFG